MTSVVLFVWLQEGEGTELGEIENVKRRLDGVHAVDDTCKAAFIACYPNVKGGQMTDRSSSS